MLVTHFVASPLWADTARTASQLYISFLHWFSHINNSVIIYKTLFICVNSVTMATMKWLIPCISPHMLFKDMNIWECFSTFFTLVWPSMFYNYHVNFLMFQLLLESVWNILYDMRVIIENCLIIGSKYSDFIKALPFRFVLTL